MMNTRLVQPRGVTLLISVILATVILSVALALLDISYKQVILASAAKQSQYAFYSADSAMECALYWDQQVDAFNYTATGYLTSGIDCYDNSGTNQRITLTSQQTTVAGYPTRITSFDIPCTGGSGQKIGTVTVLKTNTASTTIFANGYSTCNASDPKRTQRGVKVLYGGS